MRKNRNVITIEDEIFNNIIKNDLIQNNEKIVLGVSGGPDSMCMLDNLRKIKEYKKVDFEIIVAHINHMIRKEANSDEEYVKKYCEKYNIKFYVKKIDVVNFSIKNKIGVEEAGRKIRYDFFDEVLKSECANKVAIAHNKNDKAETIIMNLLRGCGITGLKGIEVIRSGKYIRPIINLEREEIERYCEDNSLNPRIDKTNFVNDCTRNKIRNIIIPYIKREFNPNIVENINRLSKIVSEEDEFMQRYTEKVYNKLLIEDNGNQLILNLKEFNMQEKVIKKRIIIYSINKILGTTQNIEMVNIEDLIKLCENNIGNKYLKPNKNIKIMVNRGKIYFESI